MKIGLITDTHYNFKKANKYFHEVFAKFYDEIFFPTLKENNIKKVIHLGDAFDNRKGVDYWALDWAKEHVYDRFRDLGIEVYNIVGNHDIYFKNSNKINSIDLLLQEYDNVISISSPKEVNFGSLTTLLLPWICQDNRKETFEIIEKTDAKVAFGHLELNGFCVYPGQYQSDGMDKKEFEKFDMVFSGHYHTRSNDGKIFYIGNPYQMFWNDVNDIRGFHIFDTDSYSLEFIENTFNLFEKIYYGEDNTDLEFLRNKIVKVIVKDNTKREDLDKFIDNILFYEPFEIKIVETISIDDSQVNCEGIESDNTISILDKYIEESQFDMDKNIVKDILKEVYQEALELE